MDEHGLCVRVRGRVVSYRVIDNDFPRCREWLRKTLGPSHCEEICIGLEKNGDLIAVTAFGWFNRKSMHQHIAIKPGEYLPREFWWFMFFYPFQTCGVDMLISINSTEQPAAMRLAQHAGYRLHATIPGGSPNGDLNIWIMRREDARPLRYKIRGQL